MIHSFSLGCLLPPDDAPILKNSAHVVGGGDAQMQKAASHPNNTLVLQVDPQLA